MYQVIDFGYDVVVGSVALTAEQLRQLDRRRIDEGVYVLEDVPGVELLDPKLDRRIAVELRPIAAVVA